MHFDRLVIEADSATVALDFHPRLTVVTGVGPRERAALTSELLGALSGAGSGAHLEIVTASGRRLAAFRPRGGRHRVVDVGEALDVSARFTDPSGRVDLLAGTSAGGLGRVDRLCFGGEDLARAERADDHVRDLAALPQDELWPAAEAAIRARTRLTDEATAAGSAPEDAAAVETVERHHDAVEAARTQHERTRNRSLATGAVAAIAAVPVTLVDPLALLPLVAVVLALVALATRQRRRYQEACAAEAAVLGEVGATSYLGFHLQRVDGLLGSVRARRDLLAVAAEAREAADAWHQLAGPVSPEFALDHRELVESLARINGGLEALHQVSATASHVDDGERAIAAALTARIAEARTAGPGGEPLPLVLDAPLDGLDRSRQAALLELLTTTAGCPQLIYLTADDDIASWARLEAMTGDVSVLEPSRTTT